MGEGENLNYVKEAEQILWHYRDLYCSVENLNHEIAMMVGSQGPKLLSVVTLDEAGIHGGGSRNDDAYNLIFRLKILTENRDTTLAELSKADRLLKNISQEPGCELYGEVLEHWYIKRTPKDDIADLTGYDVRHIYRIKDKAIRKFAVRYFGLEAMKAI